MHFCVMFVMRSSTQPKRPQHKNVYNFATTKSVLLPGLELGSKNLLPPKKMNFYVKSPRGAHEVKTEFDFKMDSFQKKI